MTNLSSGVIFLQRVNKDKLRRACELRRAMTPAERLVWERVRNNQIAGAKFRRQQIIEGFIVDFFCHPAKLVVEIDGGVHDTEDQKKADEKRKKVFANRGVEEIRFRNEEVLGNIDAVVEKITEIVVFWIGALKPL